MDRPSDALIIRALDDCLEVIGDLLTRHQETIAGEAHINIHCGVLRVRDQLAGVGMLAEPYDDGRISTHSAECWRWGPRHYECAVGEVERVRAVADATRAPDLVEALKRIATLRFHSREDDGDNAQTMEDIARAALAKLASSHP